MNSIAIRTRPCVLARDVDGESEVFKTDGIHIYICVLKTTAHLEINCNKTGTRQCTRAVWSTLECTLEYISVHLCMVMQFIS